MNSTCLLSPRHRLVSLTLGILFVLVSFADVHAKDNWISVRSKNFFLVGNASEKEIRQVATRLEQFRDVFTRLLPGAKFETPVPTTVVVFKSMGSYKPFNPSNSAGYFQRGQDVNYITLSTELGAQSPFDVIYHEYVHLLVDNTTGNMPAWFNEGLAEYYSTFLIEEDRKVHLGELIPYHLRTLREEKLLPLRTLFEVDHYSPYYNESSKRGSFYAQSWALVHYLILSNNQKYVPALARFLGLIGANVPTNDAFKQAFNMEFEVLEKELKKYIEGHSFRMQIATFERKLDFDTEMTATPITEASAQAYLGDLLLHTNNLKDAETRLQQALALDPGLTMAQASLGVLRSRQGRYAEAKSALEEAVKGNSANYLTHYYYAFALNRAGREDGSVPSFEPENVALMRAELKKAIELNPSFPESYSLLAFINVVTGEELDESIALLNRALALSPGRQDLNLRLAEIYLRQQKMDLAKQKLESLRLSSDRRIQRQAEQMLTSIKKYEDRFARIEAETSGQPGPPRLQPRDRATDAQKEEPEAMSPSDFIRDTLRPLGTGEERIQGLFNKLECDNSKGIAYFIIQATDRLYKIRATSLGSVQLTAFTQSPAAVGCGACKTTENVLLTFRPAKDPKDTKNKIDGDAIALELVPNDFQLKK